MTLSLHCLFGARQILAIDEQFLATFGRSPEADIVIEHNSVSKLHGEFYVDQGHLMIRDIGSRYGIKVNGQTVTEQVLIGGNIIEIGQIKAFLIVDSADQAQQASQLLGPEMGLNVESVQHSPSSLMNLESLDLTIAPSGSAVSKSEFPKVEHKKKGVHPVLIGAGVLVLILVIVALFKPQTPPNPESLVLTSKQYSEIVDQAVVDFRQKKYDQVVTTLQKTLDRFSQNHVSHILIDLSVLWKNKGDRYEKLNWRKAELLSQELLNVFPNTPQVQQFAKELLIWIGREEKNMATLQSALALVPSKKWDAAWDQIKSIPTECKFLELYGPEITEIKNESNRHHDSRLRQFAGQNDWVRAVAEIDILTENNTDRSDLIEVRERYLRFHQEKAFLETAQQLYAQQKFAELADPVGRIADDSPYYVEVQKLLEASAYNIHIQTRDQLYASGSGQEAIETHLKYFPEEAAFPDKVKKVMELTQEAQSILRSPSPENVVTVCQNILNIESDSNNVYVQHATQWQKRWSNKSFLASEMMQRAQKAIASDNIELARDYYLQAQSLDPKQGEDELKAFEKKAVMYYNQAMSFAIKEDYANVRVYLRKALQLIPKDSKLYDRIESYARKYLGHEE